MTAGRGVPEKWARFPTCQKKEQGRRMFDRVLTLLMVSALASAATVAETSGSQLVEAARTQNPQAIRALVGKKADVNARSGDGSTALLWLAHWNDADSADLLLRAGADANSQNDFKMTPLSQACLNASTEFVRLLLKSGANPNTAIATGETPLMTCAKTGNADAVKLLVEYGAAVNAREPSQNQTALMWAAAERHPNVVTALIGAHADLKAQTKAGFTPIHFAARIGDLESLKLLLGAGVDVNLQTGAGEDAKGATSGYTPLLIHGADPNVMAAGFTPLHWASTSWEGYASNPVYGFEDAMSGIQDRPAKLRLVKALLAHGANVNARMTKRQPSFATGYVDAVGATPLLLAASIDDVEMMKVLLAAGADPKITTSTKATAIMAATGLNHGIGESFVTEAEATEAVNLLLSLGLDAKGETTLNENALFGPAYRGWNKLLAQMIDLGVNVNAVSSAGVTPWLAANGQGDRLGGVLYNKEGADLLLKHGADPKLGTPCEAQNKCREKK